MALTPRSLCGAKQVRLVPITVTTAGRRRNSSASHKSVFPRRGTLNAARRRATDTRRSARIQIQFTPSQRASVRSCATGTIPYAAIAQ